MMSDLSMYELGDIGWDEFCTSDDDHTVPLPGAEQANELSLWVNNYQKHCLGVVDDDQDIAAKTIDTDNPPSVINRRKRMMETQPVPQASECAFNSCNQDSGNEVSLQPDDNLRFSDHSLCNEYCPADENPTNKSAAINCTSYSSQPESGTTFFHETHNIKNSGDLFYYGWPDMSNLEEVDPIFSNKDEFEWFASPEAIEASLDGTKPEFMFTYTDSSLMESNSNGCGHIRDETDSSEGKCFHDFQHRIPSSDHSTNDNSDTPRHGGQSWGESKDQLGVCSNSLRDEVLDEASRGASFEALSCKGIKRETQPMVHESLNYLPCHTYYMHSDYSSPSDLTSEYGTSSAGKFDSNGIKLYFPKESYAPNQDPLSDSLPVQRMANKFDVISDAKEVATKACPSTLQERSPDSSSFDDISSLEAASFRQLQLVMEQLDPRAKLCIRDSLYRLARSAAQRNDNADLGFYSSANDQDNRRVMLGEGTNKYTRFMEIEADTNPLDRSVAHLLFHRPSAQTATATHERSLHDSATAVAPDSMKY